MHTLSFKVRFLTCQATTQTDWWPSVLFLWHISQMTLSMLTENLHWRKSVRLSCLAAHSSKSAISDPIAQLFFIFNLFLLPQSKDHMLIMSVQTQTSQCLVPLLSHIVCSSTQQGHSVVEATSPPSQYEELQIHCRDYLVNI